MRVAMSHARTGWQTDIENLLSNGRMTDWEHTANAATVREREAFTNLSAWLKEKMIEWLRNRGRRKGRSAAKFSAGEG